MIFERKSFSCLEYTFLSVVGRTKKRKNLIGMFIVDDLDDTKFSFGLEAGYAFFLTRTVTIEPAAYWNRSEERRVGERV